MRVWLCIVVGAALFAGACSSETAEPFTLEDPAEFASERLDATDAEPPAPEAGSTADPSQTTTVPTQTQGSVIDQFSLRVGDCFNRTENPGIGRSAVITSLIDCDLPHDHQIYNMLDYPAPHPSIYPGDKVMNEFAVQSCYREFAQWVGNDYETSELDIGVITPPQENFEDDAARYRSIHCWVERFDGTPLVGDARQSGW
ncbi:MAG: septum formation family protein [Acidimicrobiaceae bacterium]|nr:septum formation family protein [Acidimicrobiia bacterium]MCY4494892.1 septum formation family protein [Acidimicrobiaceae bacterium]